MKFWKILRGKMQEYPFQIIKTEHEEFTYEATIKYAEEFSEKLKGEKCCAIYCKSEILTAFMMLACFAADVTAVPLSAKYGEKHCEKILRKISPSCVITDLCGGLNVYHLSDYEYVVPEHHPALIMSTSGTTGDPKCIMLSEENIISNLADISDYFNIGKNDSILISRPLYHVAVLTGEFLLAITKGAKIIFDSDEAFNPQRVLEIISKHNITTFCGTPTTLNILALYNSRAKNKVLLKHIVISGECMGKAVGINILTAFSNAKIYHVYGLTEASPRVCYLPPEQFEKHPDCVGIPLESVKIQIRNTAGNVLNNGEIGVLWIKGPNIMIGCYNDTEYTNSVLSDGWLCTGDIAVLKPNGFLKILGRSDDMMIRAGMNIYPTEIESVLKTDPRVVDVLIYGSYDSKMGCQINMKIVGEFNNVNEIKKLCLELLPKYQIPNKIELVTELQKSETGKVIRHEVKNA